MSDGEWDRLQASLGPAYTIVRKLGRGGMATVYLARDAKHDRDVAIKVMRPELAAAVGIERFLAEIRTTATLQHPHILSLFDSGAVDGSVYYVMPFVDGESLRDRLSRERQLPVDDAVRIAREVADALSYAHARGVLHRDIKPENILLQGGVHSHALIADFGIALATGRTGGPRLTETGMSLGTPHYMSPEQATGERDLDARSDAYALGCVLYEMLVGEPPFTGPTAQAIVAKVITEDAPRVRTRRPAVPQALDDLVAAALEKLPADRLRSAEAFRAGLDAPSAPARRAAPPRSASRRVGVALVATAVVAGGAAFLFGLHQGTRGAARPLTFGRDVHVTWDPSLELTPALSPDGRRVAYAGGPVTNLHVFVRSIGEGRVRALTGDTSAVESNPQWSPDGTRILFLSRGGVYSAPADGGPARPEVPGDERTPIVTSTWAPDGRRLAFARGDTLFVRDAEAAPRVVAHIGEPSLCVWSPTGAFVACASGNVLYSLPGPLLGNRAPSRLVLWRVGGDGIVTVVDGTALNTSPTWSNDGQWLYFVSDRDGPRDVYGIRIGGDGAARGAPVRLTTGLSAHTIMLGPSGTKLAYARFSIRSNVWQMPMPVHPPVGSTSATRVTNANESIEIFDVSRDGRWLYYDSDLPGNTDIFRVATGGGEPEQLTTDPADEFGPTPSPDGREIAYHSWRTGNREIFVQRLDGGGVTQVTHSVRQEAVPDWSPDGTALAFSDLLTNNGIGIARRDPRTGMWSAATWRGAGGAGPSWLDDGRRMAFAAGSRGGSLLVMDADTGASRVVVDATLPGAPRPVKVNSGRGDTLYYEANDAHGSATIWETTVHGSAPRPLVLLDPVLHPPNRGSFRVRNGVLYFLAQARESDVWVMDVLPR